LSRSTFGASSGDHVILAPTPVNPLLRPILNSGAVGTFWSAQTGGTQYTDILDAATGSPIAGLSTDQYGRIKRFQGPDGVMYGWADFGVGRVALASFEGIFSAGDLSGAAAAAAASATAAQNAAGNVSSTATTVATSVATSTATAVAAQVVRGNSHVSLDTDGVPYFDLNTPGTLVILTDTDGTPYFV
jgi:hypothetical protein